MHEGQAIEQGKSDCWMQSHTARYLRSNGSYAGRRGRKFLLRRGISGTGPASWTVKMLLGHLLQSNAFNTQDGASRENESRRSDDIDFLLWALLKAGSTFSSGQELVPDDRPDGKKNTSSSAQHPSILSNTQPISSDNRGRVGAYSSSTLPSPSDLPARSPDPCNFKFHFSWHEIASTCTSRLCHSSDIKVGHSEASMRPPSPAKCDEADDMPSVSWRSWSEAQRKVTASSYFYPEKPWQNVC